MFALDFDMSNACLLAPKKVSFEEFEAGRNDGLAHRICFGTTHSNKLKPYGGKYAFSFSVPFQETVGPILLEALGIKLYASKFTGFWCGLESTLEAGKLESWLAERVDQIYLRDMLDLSAATSMNISNEKRTAVGEITHKAKNEQSAKAIDKGIGILSKFIDMHPPYGTADIICPVTPRLGKAFDLPTALSLGLSGVIQKPVAVSGKWERAKPQLKETSEKNKWNALEKAGLSFSPDEIRGKRVLLIDDLYQSGATMNFVAGKLQDAGANRVFGLSLVKSLRDSDNK